LLSYLIHRSVQIDTHRSLTRKLDLRKIPGRICFQLFQKDTIPRNLGFDIAIGAAADRYVDRWGCKPMLLLGSIGMAVTLGILAFVFGTAEVNPQTGSPVLAGGQGMIALVAANLYIFFFGLSWGPVVWVLLGEMFSNKIRAAALSLAASAQWGLRARLDSSDRRWTAQAAIYDADPELRGGDSTKSDDNENGMDWSLGDNGVLLAGEVHYNRNRDSDTNLPGTFKLGGYWMSGDFKDIGKTDNSTVEGNGMLWALGEHMLYREQSGDDQGLGAFGTLLIQLGRQRERDGLLLLPRVRLQGAAPGARERQHGTGIHQGLVQRRAENIAQGLRVADQA
jgi:hypothetical protein